jgi:ATP-dependent protease ClpP protease subunit
MIHRAYATAAQPPAHSDRLQAVGQSLIVDDTRIEEILKTHTKIPPEKWEIHRYADLWLNAEDAKNYGMADIGEFSPVDGSTVFSIL